MLSPGFLLLAAWLNYTDDGGVFVAVLLSCVLHELGHLLALGLLEIPVKRINLTCLGAEICIDQVLTYGGELFSALMGPMVNLVLALVFCYVPGGSMFSGINLALACFNLLPVGNMDGGRVLRCVIAALLGEGAAQVAALCGMVFGGVVLCAAVLLASGGGGNVTLFVVCLWFLRGILDKVSEITGKD